MVTLNLNKKELILLKQIWSSNLVDAVIEEEEYKTLEEKLNKL